MHSERTPEEAIAELPPDVRAAFARTEALVCDVDGVLTDGRVTRSADGVEALAFDVRDGSGMWMLRRAGLRVGIVTGRDTGIPESGHGIFPLDGCVAGTRVKGEALRDLLARWSVAPEDCAYVGDDVLDAPALRVAGLPICVADGSRDVLPLAHYVTTRPGGRGAVREVAELILAARGVRLRLLDDLFHGRKPGGAA